MKLISSKGIAIADLSYEKDGDLYHIMLHKREGVWRCPSMTYLKQVKGGYVAAFGLKNGWQPSKKMIKDAEAVLAKNG